MGLPFGDTRGVTTITNRKNDDLPRALSNQAHLWPPGPVRRLIQTGLTWKWRHHPPRLHLPPPSTTRGPVDPLIADFLTKGVISPVPSQPCLPSPLFTVPKANGKLRLVLDLSTLNRSIPGPSFKMLDANIVRHRLPQRVWFTKIDLSDAFLHLPIHPRFRKYLALSHKGQLYFFNGAPFGLNICPRIFTRVSQVPLRLTHLQQTSASVYLDDWLIWHRDGPTCAQHCAFVLSLLKRFGFTSNSAKSELTPKRHIDYLGIAWDGLHATLLPSKSNRSSALQFLQSLQTASTINLLASQRLSGLLNSHAPLIQGGRTLFFHTLPLLPKSPGPVPVPMSAPPMTALRRWTLLLTSPVPVPFSHHPPAISLWTDACSLGWGATSSQNHQLSGPWDLPDRALHITAKESLAVLYALLLLPSLRNCSVHVFSDASATVALLKRMGSMHSPVLQEIATRLLSLLSRRHLHLTASHIPGHLNTWADSLSRTEPTGNDWTLRMSSFKTIIRTRGPLEIDLFAHPGINRLPLFMAPLPYPQALASDAMIQEWAQWTQIYLFPPPPLIPAVLRKLAQYPHHGVIILPETPGALRWTNIPLTAVQLPARLAVFQRTLHGVSYRPLTTSPAFRAWTF